MIGCQNQIPSSSRFWASATTTMPPGWEALLGHHAGKEGVSLYAAPARAEDLGDLPDAYIEVAQLDVLRDEAIAYAQRLAAALGRAR